MRVVGTRTAKFDREMPASNSSLILMHEYIVGTRILSDFITTGVTLNNVPIIKVIPLRSRNSPGLVIDRSV